MRWQRRLGLLYGILVVLIAAIGVWWAYYLSREGEHYERFNLQRFRTDQLHAVYLIETVDAIGRDPVGGLGDAFPHLRFETTADGTEVGIDPAAVAEIRAEAKRRERMFIAEGIFFLLLLAAGTAILTTAYRRQRDFERARELFLAGATHEFKTPLASLRLYTETLQRPDLGADAGARVRRAMLQDIERLEGMVEQVLAVSREEELGRGPDEPLDLAVEARRVLDDLAPFLDDRGAHLETDLPPDHLIRGDRFALAVALRNLVQNAALYSPPPARIRVALTRDGDVHRLAVADRGPGIARRDRQRVFESFTRLDAPPGSLTERPRGSGLGLYLVRRNAAALGGRVELESEEGEGSVFTLVLPVHEEES